MSAPSTALALAAQGIPCFPVLASKAPACPTGFKAARVDADALHDLWRRYPGPLIGVPTGQVSGFDALDLDLTKHAEARAWWQSHRERMPQTRSHDTRSGGLHLLLQHAAGLRCSAAKLAPGVDVRADGGFIVWWPAAGLPLAVDGAIAAWPQWLLAELMPPPKPRIWAAPIITARDGDAAHRYAIAALRRAVERVAASGIGARNDTLNAQAFVLARFIAAGQLSPSEIAGALASAALAAGLTAAETERTLASALRAGAGA